MGTLLVPPAPLPSSRPWGSLDEKYCIPRGLAGLSCHQLGEESMVQRVARWLSGGFKADVYILNCMLLAASCLSLR